MKIRITDIPAEGLEVDFNVERANLTERIDADRLNLPTDSIMPPKYVFLADPDVKLRLELEGTMIVITGKVVGEIETTCARCADDARQILDVPIGVVLKPLTQPGDKIGPDMEDLSFGYYNGQEVELTPFAEEFLILALPFTVYCRDECKGLCPFCGTNFNLSSCKCTEEHHATGPLAGLAQLKTLIH